MKNQIKQYIEITQLFFCLRRNMAKGPRVPVVGIPLEQVMQFGQLLAGTDGGGGELANSTATESPAATAVQPDAPFRPEMSLTEKKFLGGALPMQKLQYFKGEPRGSIAATNQLDGLRRATVNVSGARSKYGRNALAQADSLRPSQMRIAHTPMRVDEDAHTGCVIKMN